MPSGRLIASAFACESPTMATVADVAGGDRRARCERGRLVGHGVVAQVGRDRQQHRAGSAVRRSATDPSVVAASVAAASSSNVASPPPSNRLNGVDADVEHHEAAEQHRPADQRRVGDRRPVAATNP